ncbi:MAG: PilZ domain-containing protein [Candidatus Omnitrophica bacterium]|nr:PilZ domain-containing protein [Candidatus Omnitrophota bacterium]
MGAENRFFARFLVAGTILVQIRLQGGVKTIKGELLDLSFKGGGFCSKEQLKKEDSIIFLLLNNELGVRLRGEAKIVSVQKILRKGTELFRYGMEFRKLDSEALQDIVLNLQKDIKRGSGGPGVK